LNAQPTTCRRVQRYPIPRARGWRSTFPVLKETMRTGMTQCKSRTSPRFWLLGSASAEMKSPFENAESYAARPRVGHTVAWRRSRTFRLEVVAAVKDDRQISHQLRARWASAAHMALFKLQCGRPVRPTGWLSEIYLIDDTEPGRRDDIRQTVFPTSSAMSSPPDRSTAKPTGLPRA
jgi:hypothetical protein